MLRIAGTESAPAPVTVDDGEKAFDQWAYGEASEAIRQLAVRLGVPVTISVKVAGIEITVSTA